MSNTTDRADVKPQPIPALEAQFIEGLRSLNDAQFARFLDLIRADLVAQARRA